MAASSFLFCLLLLPLFSVFFAASVDAHPFCLDNEPPQVPQEELLVCRAFNFYPGSCCTVEDEVREVIVPRGRLVRGRDSQSLDCRRILQKVLCAPCSPLSGHIFGSEYGQEKDYPRLCMRFCRSFYQACANVEITTNISTTFVKKWRIPGLQRGRGNQKIVDYYPTVTSYCNEFGGEDIGSCYTNSREELENPPPETPVPVAPVPVALVPVAPVPVAPSPVASPQAPRAKVVRVLRIFKKLNFSSVRLDNTLWRLHLTDVIFDKSSNRVIVTFQHGIAVWFDNNDNVDRFSTFIDMVDIASYKESSERGLMGLTLDPQFQRNGYVYAKYTFMKNGKNDIIVSRFQLQSGKYELDRGSERILFRIPRDGTMHHSGPAVFAPDGTMFIPVGDGQSSGAYRQSSSPAKFLNTLRGKVLRVDVRDSAARPNNYTGPLYTIPSDNPFINRANVLPEIYAYGFRNPWQLHVDPRRGDVWVGDVGHDRFEEVNLVTKGSDGGWNTKEGDYCYWPTANCRVTAEHQAPIVWHAHLTWCTKLSIPNCMPANSVVAGLWYYGDKIKSLQNRFVYGEYELGKIFTLRIPNRDKPRENISVTTLPLDFVPGSQPVRPDRFKPVAFRYDQDGEIVIVNWNFPSLYRLIEVEVAAADELQSEMDERVDADWEQSVALNTTLSATGEFFDGEDDAE